MCFCVNGGNDGCVVPSSRALAVPGDHGQSRGTIMDSQEGLFHWVQILSAELGYRGIAVVCHCLQGNSVQKS